MLIDTHAHLQTEPLLSEAPEAVVARAKAAGVGIIINVNSTEAGPQGALELARKFDDVYAVIGFHPYDAKEINMQQLTTAITHPKVVAIGEIGLDYYKNECPRDVQKQAFEQQLALAAEFQKPVIIHNREADQDTLEILDQYKLAKVVFHCYSSTLEYAKKILDRDWLISFTGNITFPKNISGQEVVKYVPLGRMMLETDCPFMTPVPYRGKTNEPAYVSVIAEKVAELKGLNLAQIAEATTRNAREFFKLS